MRLASSREWVILTELQAWKAPDRDTTEPLNILRFLMREEVSSEGNGPIQHPTPQLSLAYPSQALMGFRSFQIERKNFTITTQFLNVAPFCRLDHRSLR